jgi:hypothetical protein
VGDEPNPRPPQHITANASGQAQMPIAAGNMTNIWGDTAGHLDFRVHLHHEADEVVLTPAQDTPFTVEIRNDRPSERKLALHLINLPGGTLRIRTRDGVVGPPGETTVSVPPSDGVVVTMIVRCAATAPPAGPRDIHVRATDTVTGDRLDSRPKSVRVQSRPALTLETVGFTRQPGTTRYTAQLTVTNSGNARVAGTLVPMPPSQPGSMPPWNATCDGGFDLEPEEHGSVTVAVSLLSRAFGARAWRLPLHAAVDRDGVTLTPGHVELVDRGLGHDLAKAVAALGPQTQRLLRWGRRPVTAPRGLLAGGAVCLVTLVTLLSNCDGTDARPASAPQKPASSASVIASAAAASPAQAEIAAYRADWPGLPCEPFDGGSTGTIGSLCRFGGVELYLWSYASQPARNADRDKRSKLDAKGCAKQSRRGTWAATGGRGGQYLEYSIVDTIGRCWARIWWDSGDTDPTGVGAAMLSARWDTDLHSSWDPLRTIWLSHGYRFDG